MNAQLTREEREALIAGGRAHPLEPDELDDLQLLADLLEQSTTWAEPTPELEDAVVRAVEGLPGRTRLASRNLRLLVACVAAAMALAAALVVTRHHSASEAFEAELHAPGATRASATVHITENDSGYHIVLAGKGLRRLDRDTHYYQAWLETPAGVEVPVGTFISCQDPITLWSGADPETFTTMTVTLEATDNNQASSGIVVLAGKVVET
jgi:hypothetical protein